MKERTLACLTGYSVEEFRKIRDRHLERGRHWTWTAHNGRDSVCTSTPGIAEIERLCRAPDSIEYTERGVAEIERLCHLDTGSISTRADHALDRGLGILDGRGPFRVKIVHLLRSRAAGSAFHRDTLSVVDFLAPLNSRLRVGRYVWVEPLGVTGTYHVCPEPQLTTGGEPCRRCG